MLAHHRFNLRAFELPGFMPGDKNNVPSAAAGGRESTESRANDATTTVALDGTAEFFSRSNADTANAARFLSV
jgi:hypothetical protein